MPIRRLEPRREDVDDVVAIDPRPDLRLLDEPLAERRVGHQLRQSADIEQRHHRREDECD